MAATYIPPAAVPVETDPVAATALASAVASLTTAIAAKQNAGEAATDVELTAMQIGLTNSIATVQQAVDAAAAVGATDVEVASAVAALAAVVATDVELAAAIAPVQAQLDAASGPLSEMWAHAPTGIVGTDMPMLEEFVDDLPEYGLGILRGGGETPYAIEGAWEIRKNCSIRGPGGFGNYDAAGQNVDRPLGDPPLVGCVLLQTQAGAHGVSCPVSRTRVDLEGFGVLFDAAIRYTNTGHGFSVLPETTFGTGLNHGLLHAIWRGLRVYGHDGNHYGIRWVNPLLGHIELFRSWGGGVIQMEGNSASIGSGGYNYGNVTVLNAYGQLGIAGTAHGYSLKSNRQDAIALITFIRPQCNASGNFGGQSPPAAPQRLFKGNDGFDASFALLGGKDFEGALDPEYGSHLRAYIEPGGVSGTTHIKHRVMTDLSGRHLDSDLEIPGEANVRKPTIAAGAGAGVGATATIDNGSSDFRGGISITTGSSGISVASGSVAATITHFTSGSVKNLKIVPRNLAAASAGLLVNVSGIGATSSLRFTGGTAPAAGTLLTYAYDGDPV